MQCLYEKLNPKYAKVRVPNTSPAVHHTSKSFLTLRIKSDIRVLYLRKHKLRNYNLEVNILTGMTHSPLYVISGYCGMEWRLWLSNTCSQLVIISLVMYVTLHLLASRSPPVNVKNLTSAYQRNLLPPLARLKWLIVLRRPWIRI